MPFTVSSTFHTFLICVQVFERNGLNLTSFTRELKNRGSLLTTSTMNRPSDYLYLKLLSDANLLLGSMHSWLQMNSTTGLPLILWSFSCPSFSGQLSLL